ncbi:flagellar basal body-associated FliL family protein [Campylobacter hyointestinalis]|uniref:flagellar basal body-associated FliL family protein n=1 Tax=Campylobacter hyointestinalis TaxID=198 RepID=UPI000DCEEFFC|nr:flagellar basal body-associated FliL family protein [Campylobacter hyointestinalis]RAZ61225.1 hypothetical protein CHL10071_02155 [Campylobacter hyointestinalis subsp. lawsonii]
MKKFILMLMFCQAVFGGSLVINDFQSDLYSKAGVNNMKKITMNLELITRDESVDKAPIYDAINVIVSSFYVEDMMTSLGKENFKKTLIQYISKKYGIDIDEVYIISLKTINEIDIEKIIKAIKDRDLCNSSKDINLNNDTDIIKDFGKDFGEN